MSDFRMRFRKFSRHSNESEREHIGRRLESTVASFEWGQDVLPGFEASPRGLG